MIDATQLLIGVATAIFTCLLGDLVHHVQDRRYVERAREWCCALIACRLTKETAQ